MNSKNRLNCYIMMKFTFIGLRIKKEKTISMEDDMGKDNGTGSFGELPRKVLKTGLLLALVYLSSSPRHVAGESRPGRSR